MARHGDSGSPGTASGSKTKGMAAEAATASGSAPLSISLYSPFLDTTPTANSCTVCGVSHGAHPSQAYEVLSCYRLAGMVTEGQVDRAGHSVFCIPKGQAGRLRSRGDLHRQQHSLC